MQRPLLKQEFATFSLSVAINGTPINPNMGLTAMVDTILICIPVAAANSVFLGSDPGVTIVTGLELIAGTTTAFEIKQDRQLYELQYPLMDIKNSAMCKQDQGEQIPFIAWDVAAMFLVAAAITVVTIAVFKAVYV